jgi:hypothetical protein
MLAYDRRDEREAWTVLVNFTSRPVAYPATGTIVVASDLKGQRDSYDGTLGPDRALVLRR